MKSFLKAGQVVGGTGTAWKTEVKSAEALLSVRVSLDISLQCCSRQFKQLVVSLEKGEKMNVFTHAVAYKLKYIRKRHTVTVLALNTSHVLWAVTIGDRTLIENAV